MRSSLTTLSVAAMPFALACATSPRAAAPSASVGGSSPCRVEGVWRLESMTRGGRPERMNWEQWKVVTRGHFMWVAQDLRRDTLPLATQLDSLRAIRVDGGAGPYELHGDEYVEHLEIFVYPALVGRTFHARCRTEGDRWYHRFSLRELGFSPSAQPDSDIVEEVWRRIE